MKKLRDILMSIMLESVYIGIFVYAFMKQGGENMEIIKNNLAYIVGFLTIPTIRLIIKVFQSTIKSAKHKYIAKKNSNYKQNKQKRKFDV